MGARLEGGVDLRGVALCGIAAVALAIATLTVSAASSSGNVLMIVGLQMFVGAAVLGVFAVALEDWQVAWTPRLGVAFAYTTLVPGLIAMFGYLMVVPPCGPDRAGAGRDLPLPQPVLRSDRRGRPAGRAAALGRRHRRGGHHGGDSGGAVVASARGLRERRPPAPSRCHQRLVEGPRERPPSRGSSERRASPAGTRQSANVKRLPSR